MCKQCTNYTKPIQLANWYNLCMFLYTQIMYKLYKIYTNVNWIMHAAADVSFLYIQNLYILYFSNFCINNDTLFHSILQLCKISKQIFSYSKRFTGEFTLKIYLALIWFISILILVTFFWSMFFLFIYFLFWQIVN